MQQVHLNQIKDITATEAEINVLQGILASTADLNKLVGLTVSTIELNQLSSLLVDFTAHEALDFATAHPITSIHGGLIEDGTIALVKLNFTPLQAADLVSLEIDISSNQSNISTLQTDVGNIQAILIPGVSGDLADAIQDMIDHLADPVDAHNAEAISFDGRITLLADTVAINTYFELSSLTDLLFFRTGDTVEINDNVTAATSHTIDSLDIPQLRVNLTAPVGAVYTTAAIATAQDLDLDDGQEILFHLMQQTTASSLGSNQDRNLKLVRGGLWSWDLGLTQLSFTADAFIQIPSLAESANTIQLAQSPITFASDGDVAYIDIDRTGPGPTNLTISVAAISGMTFDPDRLIIARRIGSDAYIGNGSIRLVDGATHALDEGLPLTTAGDMAFRDASNLLARLPAGPSRKVLRVNASNIPEWKDENIPVTIGPAGSDADFVADGTNDNLDFDAARSAAALTGGGTIFIMAGSYVFGSTHNFAATDVKYIGAGSDAVTIELPPAASIGSGAGDVRIEGVKFDVTGTGTFTLDNTGWVILKDVLTDVANVILQLNTETHAYDCEFIEVDATTDFLATSSVVTTLTTSSPACLTKSKVTLLNLAGFLRATNSTIDDLRIHAILDKSLFLGSCEVGTFSQDQGTDIATDCSLVGCRILSGSVPSFVTGNFKGTIPSSIDTDTGGTGGGGTGLTPDEGYQTALEDNFTVDSSNVDSSVDGSLTTGLYDPANKLYKLDCDSTVTITNTTPSPTFSLSAPPGFTIQVGDIVWSNVNQEFRKIVSLVDQQNGDLDAPFTSSILNDSGLISQALYTKDIVNFGDAVQEDRLRDLFGVKEHTLVKVDYFDSTTLGDNIPDFVNTARVVFVSTAEGAVGDVTVPLSTDFGPIFKRPLFGNRIPDYVLPDLGLDERLFFVFFCNPDIALAGSANLIRYKLSSYALDVIEGGFTQNSAFCMSDGTGTDNNCSQSVVVGKTRVVLGFPYNTGVNPGEPDGDLDVILDGNPLPRFFAGVIGPYWTEIDEFTYDLDTDYSGSAFSIHSRKFRGSGDIDSSAENAALLSENRLGSTNAAIDKSVTGEGILLRASNGTLVEASIKFVGPNYTWEFAEV